MQSFLAIKTLVPNQDCFLQSKRPRSKKYNARVWPIKRFHLQTHCTDDYEVEAAVSEHPEVRSCVVVGLPDLEFGQRVHAILELADEADAQTIADGMGDFLKDKLGSVVLALAAVVDGNPILITMVTPDLVERGLHAGNIARDTAKVMGGGGGGRPEMAQAGGKQPEKVDEALSGVPDLVRQGLS